MAFNPIKEQYPAIFLSASIPTQDERGRPYLETADVIAIRESVKALVSAAIPSYAIVWGGHPSITPLIRLLAETHPKNVVDYFVLYQSKEFKTIAPKDNEFFRHVFWEDTLDLMRQRMIKEPNYLASFFVGGMKGIEDEFFQFRALHPDKPTFPVASTGGAANVLFQQWAKPLHLLPALQIETAYPFLFRQLIKELGKK
jgi:hypothetical protein